MHTGTKVKRIREFRGLKQEALAVKLGISHQAVSKIEQSEEIEDDKLASIAEALGVTVDTIKNFDENAVLGVSNFFNPHFEGNSTAVHNSFNPLEKLMELVDENRNLYERMLETERSKVKLLEDLLKTKA